MIAYTLYRFECGLRSSAVMGFMGVLTLGYYIDASFENRHYHEVWTYLYALIALIVFFEKWSDAIRRRLVEGPT
jgi:phosphonate transport system permease protein